MSNRGNKRNASAMSDSDDLDTNDGHYDHSVRGVPATPGGGMAYVTSSPDMGPQRDLPPSSPPPVATPFVASNIDGDDESDDETRRVLQAQYEEEDRALRMAQEAEEVEEEGEALAEDEEDEEGEDLFGPSMELDYLVNPEKDKYDEADIDDAEYEAMDPATRARVEARLRRRDLEQGLGAAKSRIPAAFLQGTFGDDDDDDDDVRIGGRRRRVPGDVNNIHAALFEQVMDMQDEERELSLDDLRDIKGRSVASWINEPGPRQTITREFRHFLLSYVDEQGASVYGERIRKLGENNGESLEVSYVHLASSRPLLAYFLANAPRAMLAIMDDVAMDAVLTVFPDYARIRPEIHIRISDLPTMCTLRELRQSQLNCLVRVHGVVSRRTSVFPQLKYVKFNCTKCGAVLGPFYQDSQAEIKLGMCTHCQSRGPFTIDSEQTVYRNYQKITLQETPGSVPAGRLPRHREVVLLWDLIDCAKPGDEIEVTGIYGHTYDVSLNTKQGFPVFATVIEANHIKRRADEFAAFRLTEEDRRAIRALARDKNIGRRIIRSIAPSIYGHEHIKTGVALSLFGGVAKDINGKARTRGDINVLLLGDPGTAKSQILKYVESTAHRAVFTTGQGASAVGLTASVRKDPVTREWTLEGGALVLADRGVCLIDEFDKMNDADRTSIHEAMEQQTISLSKAGIVTTLQARCAVIAAANPIGGRYRPSLPFSQNVELTEPILSRFDVLCVVRDEVDPIRDEQLGKFVVQSHIRSHPRFQSQTRNMQALQEVSGGGEGQSMSTLSATALGDADIIPQDLLRKYIMYARENITPRMNQVDQDKIMHLYAELRRESLVTGSIPITVRHVEAIIRLSEAHARMHLREHVRSDDVEVAIRVVLESFISAQKLSVKKPLRRVFAKYLTARRDVFEALHFVLSRLIQDKLTFYQYAHSGRLPAEVRIPREEFESQARSMQIHDCTRFYQSRLFLDQGFRFDDTGNFVIKNFATAEVVSISG